MSQRLALTTEKNGQISVADLEAFVNTAKQYGQGKKFADFTCTKGVLTIRLSLPNDTKVIGKRVVKIKPKTKREQAVEKQISEHKKAKENGENEGYVPPVGRKTPPKPTKIKCPRCGIRKATQMLNKSRILKPHQFRGEPCEGSGVQV